MLKNTPAMAKPAVLAGFPVVVRDKIRWGEMDAFQHLNNTVYFRFFEEARIAYFDAAGFKATFPIGPILKSTSCKFRIPCTYPDTMLCAARVTAQSDDRFTMAYAVYSTAHDAIAAEGDGVVVCFNYETQQKAKLPATWQEAMARLADEAGGPA